jgi:hypothetical protein
MFRSLSNNHGNVPRPRSVMVFEHRGCDIPKQVPRGALEPSVDFDVEAASGDDAVYPIRPEARLLVSVELNRAAIIYVFACPGRAEVSLAMPGLWSDFILRQI